MSEKKKIRVAKLDGKNYVVQEWRETTSKKTGETTSDWFDLGYYGCHLEVAVRFALLAGVPENKSLLGEFKAASDAIVKAIQES